jgi:hypothetical protein
MSMSEPKPTSDKSNETEDQAGIPRWVKTIGAVVGILATAAGIFVGISTLVKEFRETTREIAKEKRQQAEEEAKAEKQRTEQIRLQNEAEGQAAERRIEEIRLRSESERKSEEQRSEQLSLENEAKEKEHEAKLSEEQQKTRQAEIQLEIIERQELRADKISQRDERISNQKVLLEEVSKLAGSRAPESSSLNSLLKISRFADEAESRDMIVRALAAYADKSCSPSELHLIFSTLSSMDMDEDLFQEIVNLNRLGFKQFEAINQDYFVTALYGLKDKLNTSGNYALCRAIQVVVRNSRAVEVELQRSLLFAYWENNRSLIYDVLHGPPLVSGGISSCPDELLLTSSKAIEKAIPRMLKKNLPIDLSDTYLVMDIPVVYINKLSRSHVSFEGNAIAFSKEEEDALKRFHQACPGW